MEDNEYYFFFKLKIICRQIIEKFGLQKTKEINAIKTFANQYTFKLLK